MKTRLMEDLKKAMKSTDENRTIKLSSIKAVRQAVLDFEKEKKTNITEESFATLVDGLINSREKSIIAYKEAKREDLVIAEQSEIDIIKTYLPERVSNEEIEKEALLLKDKLGADSMRFMGQMMEQLKNYFGVSAKPADISRIVKEILS